MYGVSRRFELFPRRFGIAPYIWLCYMVVPLSTVLQKRGQPLVLGLGAIALFLISYWKLYRVDGKAYMDWLVVQMALVTLLGWRIHPNLAFMGFFPANFIGFVSKERQMGTMTALLVAATLTPMLMHMDVLSLSDLLFGTPFMILMWATPLLVKGLSKRRELTRELEVAHEQIGELVKREERLRIARDLHDTLGHTLSLITLKSQLAEKLAESDPARARAEAAEIGAASRAALSQVRELVSQMRYIRISEELAEAEMMLQSAGIRVGVEGDTELAVLSAVRQNMVSMCLKEAVTNIVRHSGASRCRILIQQDRQAVRIRVSDNGRGWTEECRPGNGLQGMAERLAFVEGEMEMGVQEGETVLTLTLPLPTVAEETGA